MATFQKSSLPRLIAVASALCMALTAAGCGSSSNSSNSGDSSSNGSVTLNLATAGDTNMVDLQDQSAIPAFQKNNPNAKINVVGTGAGDSGSVTIVNKLKAQKDAGKKTWDTDIAIVHQSAMKQLIDEGLIEKWLPNSTNGKYVTADNAKNSLGTDVTGYVAPLYQSQIAIAYNSTKISKPFSAFSDLETWIKANPKRFGYNGIKNGASGVGFVDSWVYWKSGQQKQLINGPYDASIESSWAPILKDLKSLPVTYTDGNNGTLDLLNRGEIDAGPVWVDMYSQWQSDGRLNPDIKVSIPKEGMPGQPMYIVVTSGASNKEAAEKYADFLISPEFQASVIVDKMSWYPGIDANQVLSKVSSEGKERLFGVITPEILASSGLPYPIAEYKKDIETQYGND